MNGGRNVVRPKPSAAGVAMSRPFTTTWYMQPQTGYISPKDGQPSGWVRGSVARWGAPSLRPDGRNLFMYDSSDPLTWNNPGN